MKKPPSKLIRALGLVVGSLFIVVSLLIAREEGLASFDSIARLVTTVALGIVFVFYGATGSTPFTNLSSGGRRIVGIAVCTIQMGLGIYLLLAPGLSVASGIVGVTLLCLGLGTAMFSHASRKSSPAA